MRPARFIWLKPLPLGHLMRLSRDLVFFGKIVPVTATIIGLATATATTPLVAKPPSPASDTA